MDPIKKFEAPIRIFLSYIGHRQNDVKSLAEIFSGSKKVPPDSTGLLPGNRSDFLRADQVSSMKAEPTLKTDPKGPLLGFTHRMPTANGGRGMPMR